MGNPDWKTGKVEQKHVYLYNGARGKEINCGSKQAEGRVARYEERNRGRMMLECVREGREDP